MTAAQNANREKTLNQQVRYREGIMTRKAWIEMQKNNGATVAEYEKTRIQFNRIKYNRMNGWEQAEYEKKCDEKVVAYKLKEDAKNDTYFEITKTEYDYFNSL